MKKSMKGSMKMGKGGSATKGKMTAGGGYPTTSMGGSKGKMSMKMKKM